MFQLSAFETVIKTPTPALSSQMATTDLDSCRQVEQAETNTHRFFLGKNAGNLRCHNAGRNYPSLGKANLAADPDSPVALFLALSRPVRTLFEGRFGA